MDEEREEGARRSTAARVGVSLLNLLAPGVGLVRIGRSRAGLAFLIAPFALLLSLAAAAALLPTMSPAGFLVLLALLVPVGLFLLIGPVIATWRGSRVKTPHLPWWRRWYALVGIVVLFEVANVPAVDLLHGSYKPFYVPAESMAPTFEVGDRLVAGMRQGRPPRPGEVVLLRVPGGVYVKRVAAVGGDRIEMIAGVLIVNGKAAVQRKIGVVRQSGGFAGQEADMLVERFPGEAGEHRILETGPSVVDDMTEVTVPPGHVFVLGDNRDRSADSRVSRLEQGVEMVPLADVVGRPLFRTWSEDWRWIGTPVR